MEGIQFKNSSSKCARKRRHKTRVTLSITCGIKILSYRQYYVHSQFLEVLTETRTDVEYGNSNGARNFYSGQVRIWCVYSIHMHPRGHYDRAMCYSRSISHINHTVENIQTFHFEACSVIPDKIKNIIVPLRRING